jgi:phosphoenolpyruvate synthase/pyruvate phosphate dikinase
VNTPYCPQKERLNEIEKCLPEWIVKLAKLFEEKNRIPRSEAYLSLLLQSH